MTEQRAQVGVGLIVIKGNKVLLGRRKGSHGAGEYAGAGGHLEYMESFEQTAIRELAEEAGPGLKVTKPEFLCLNNLTEYAPKHYVDIAMVSKWISGEPRVMEPDKLESWDWYDIDNLPSPLFNVIDNYITAYKTGQKYFEN